MSDVMHNMKIARSGGGAISDDIMQDKPEYPYGLRISLEPQIIERLSLGKLPEVGAMMRLVASVEVVEIRLENAQNGGRDKHMSLQITDMDLQAKSPDSNPGEPEQPKTILGS